MENLLSGCLRRTQRVIETRIYNVRLAHDGHLHPPRHFGSVRGSLLAGLFIEIGLLFGLIRQSRATLDDQLCRLLPAHFRSNPGLAAVGRFETHHQWERIGQSTFRIPNLFEILP